MITSIDEPTLQLLLDFRRELEAELTGNILPFYINHAIDHERGGFYGFVSNDLVADKSAAKGVIQTTRTLWAFAQAGRVLGSQTDRAVAERAYAYTLTRFWDPRFGGLYWMLDCDGQPLETFKMVYGQAFGIYALAEFFMATGERHSLDKAIEIYNLLEEHAVDSEQGGYWEACQQDWTPDLTRAVDTVALSVVKSMNTHLHMLEAYTNLLRAWPDVGLRQRLRALIRITIDHIVDTNGHFILHFDAGWQRLNHHISYGHDIEGSWLLVEAAEVLGDPVLLAETEAVALRMAEATLAEGIDADGGVVNEGNPAGITDRSKDWWPQAEAMVGFFNAYELSGDRRFLEQSLASWRYIQRAIIDHRHGEWFWGVTQDGAVRNLQKTGPWKAAYHNGRACMEIMRRVDKLVNHPER
jgi:mannobiose 2-epimerase